MRRESDVAAYNAQFQAFIHMMMAGAIPRDSQAALDCAKSDGVGDGLRGSLSSKNDWEPSMQYAHPSIEEPLRLALTGVNRLSSNESLDKSLGPLTAQWAHSSIEGPMKSTEASGFSNNIPLNTSLGPLTPCTARRAHPSTAEPMQSAEVDLVPNDMPSDPFTTSASAPTSTLQSPFTTPEYSLSSPPPMAPSTVTSSAMDCEDAPITPCPRRRQRYSSQPYPVISQRISSPDQTTPRPSRRPQQAVAGGPLYAPFPRRTRTGPLFSVITQAAMERPMESVYKSGRDWVVLAPRILAGVEKLDGQ